LISDLEPWHCSADSGGEGERGEEGGGEEKKRGDNSSSAWVHLWNLMSLGRGRGKRGGKPRSVARIVVSNVAGLDYEGEKKAIPRNSPSRIQNPYLTDNMGGRKRGRRRRGSIVIFPLKSDSFSRTALDWEGGGGGEKESICQILCIIYTVGPRWVIPP